MNLPNYSPLDINTRPMPFSGQPRILLVEDDPVTLARMAACIESQPDLILAAAVTNAADAIEWLYDNEPDVLLVDLGLPDASGTEVIRYAVNRYPQSESMVITVFGDEAHVLESIEAGATGYVLKDSSPEEIAAHIRQLLSGGSPISPAIARRLLMRQKKVGDPHPPMTDRRSYNKPAVELILTEREADILSQIAKGYTAPEIARRSNLSAHTVTTHIKSIYRKLAVHSRAEAVVQAQRFGFVAHDRRRPSSEGG